MVTTREMEGRDATLSTISHELRQQLLRATAATADEQARAESLRSSDLPLINVQAFGRPAYSVSRKHALLEKDGRYVTLTDLQSTNGTHLNGTLLYPMQRRVVRNGDKLQLGGLQLRLSFGRMALVSETKVSYASGGL